MGRRSCAGGVFVIVARTGMAKAGTGGVDVVVVPFVVPFEAASFRPSAEVSCVVGKGLGRLRGREEKPSMKGVPNLLGREPFFFCKYFSVFLGITVFVVLLVCIVA